jgi:hypothetical protein
MFSRRVRSTFGGGEIWRGRVCAGRTAGFALPGILCATLLALGAEPQAGPTRVTPLDAAQKQGFERQPKVAVLAGVGRYPTRSGLTQLRYPAHDVDLMEAELEKQGYKVVALRDQEATRGAIEQSLVDARELVDQNSGTIAFFFSGHGFAEQGQNYLATYEAAAANLAGSGLPVERVEELLKASGAQRQMVFLDACRSEAGKAIGARSFGQLQGAAGLHALLSTKAGRVSYEDETLGSGVFTHFLVEGLRGRAAGADGLITFHDLATFVVDAVSAYGFQHGQMQVPYEAGEFSGDFLVAEGAGVSGAPEAPVVPTGVGLVVGRDTSGHKPGDLWTNPKDGLSYVWIPPGSFRMGCLSGGLDCSNDEPAHMVTISKGSWMGKTLVIQGAYQRVMGGNPSQIAKDRKLPVDSVTWKEAESYCESVGGRLPTEAEWEYAARWDSRSAALDDMLGSRYQWTSDWYSSYGAESQVDPQGPAYGDKRATRGSFSATPTMGSVSGRYGVVPFFRNGSYSFRCLREIP